MADASPPPRSFPSRPLRPTTPVIRAVPKWTATAVRSAGNGSSRPADVAQTRVVAWVAARALARGRRATSPRADAMTPSQRTLLWVYAAIIAMWPIRHLALWFIFRKLDILTGKTPAPRKPSASEMLPLCREAEDVGETKMSEHEMPVAIGA